jgi:hypothetical protein
MKGAVPYVGNISCEQAPRASPIRLVVIQHLTDGAGADGPVAHLGAGARSLISPIRVIIHPLRWIRHHQVRLDAAEHALDVRRHRAVAAEEPVPALRLRGELRAALGAATPRFRLSFLTSRIGDLLERPAVIRQDGGTASELRPSLYAYVYICWGNFHAQAADEPRHFGG